MLFKRLTMRKNYKKVSYTHNDKEWRLSLKRSLPPGRNKRRETADFLGRKLGGKPWRIESKWENLAFSTDQIEFDYGSLFTALWKRPGNVSIFAMEAIFSPILLVKKAEEDKLFLEIDIFSSVLPVPHKAIRKSVRNTAWFVIQL